MDRIANPEFFRAEAVAIDWNAVLKAHEGVDDHRQEDQRAWTARLSWACHEDLGVPHGVFTVWARTAPDEVAESVEVDLTPVGDGMQLSWREPAGRVLIDVAAVSQTSPVTITLFWRTRTEESITAIRSVMPAGGRVRVDMRTSGATCALLTNVSSGDDPVVQIVSLNAIVDADDWEEIEHVGLPIDEAGLADTDYDGLKQGLVATPQEARDAAVDRLARGAPRAGWFPALPSGMAAPPWQAPDSARLVDLLQHEFLNRIAPLYRAGLPENEQAALRNAIEVDGPAGAGQPAVIDAAPWPLLVVPATTDPFMNLALGFGTAYPSAGMPEGVRLPPLPEFLVTARYTSEPVFRASGPGWNVEVQLPKGEYAAYAPLAPHSQTPAPMPFVPSRYSSQPPVSRDAPWRENVRSTWPPLPAAAGSVHVTQFAPVRASLGAFEAEALFPFDADYDGWRIPNLPPLAPGDVLHSSVDPLAEIPLGSGGRQQVYAAAHSDVYGVWSPWSEGIYSGTEPAAAPPMLANLKLVSRYAGTPQCPATLDVEVVVEWRERSTSSVDLSAVFYPMSSPSAQPPAGIGPETAPPGAFAHSFSLSFAGDVPTGVGCTVSPLDANGVPAATFGAGQGEPRRYAVHVELPPLDFAVTDRWGVDLWARRSLVVGPTPSVWGPTDPARAMVTSVGSPVPVVPTITRLPGVPLASLPDSDGRSHAAVVWGAPSPNNAKSFVIWQASEEYLRERCGVPEPDPRTVAGARLVALRQLLIDRPEACRLAFRRVLEVPGDRREADIALARGSRSIQFFVVTSTTRAGADSPWPINTATQDYTQVFIAPRVVVPGQPLARPVITPAGVEIDLEVPSEVPVLRFRVYRTQSFDAARRADSMGAPQLVTAVAPADPPAAGDRDLVTGLPLYRARWSDALTPSWRTWYVRTTAEPDTTTIPERGWRGQLSPASDIVTVRVPPSTPPDLDPLVVEAVTPDRTVLVARTSTAAPIPDTDFGPHLIAAATGDSVTAATLEAVVPSSLSAVSATEPPPAPAPGVAVVTRGTRVDGRTPLAIWFTRTDASDPVDVGLRLVDPLGRSSVEVTTVAGWTAPQPPDFALVGVKAVSASVSVVTVSSTVPRTATPPYTLAVSAARRGTLHLPTGPVVVPVPSPSLGPALTASIALSDIRMDGGGSLELPLRPLYPAGRRIRFAYRKGPHGATLYDILIPLASPFAARLILTSPAGAQASLRATG